MRDKLTRKGRWSYTHSLLLAQAHFKVSNEWIGSMYETALSDGRSRSHSIDWSFGFKGINRTSITPSYM